MGGIATPPISMAPAMNPILAEIDAAHASLSPDAQAAIEKAHGIAAPAGMAGGTGIAAPNGPPLELPPGGGIQAPAPTTVGSGITPPGAESPKLATPSVDDNVSSAAIKPAGALGVSSLGSKMPETPAVAPIGSGQVSPELARLTKPDTHQHDTNNTGTPGVNQIHNPWARVPLQILDALGRGFFPGVEMAIPGTSGHHDVLVHQRQVEDTQERDAQDEAAKRELEAAQAQKDLHPGESKDWQEIAGGAIDPAHPELGPQPAFYNKNDPGQGVKFGNVSLGKKEIAEKHDVHAMYADAVSDALKRGVEPKDDPKVQQTLAAITALNKEPNPSKPDVHVLYADAINDAIKRGVDPNEDPKVQQIAKSITGLQKESGHNVPLEEQVINEHISKVHPGETMAQARQHTQPAPQRDPTAALDRETTKFGKPHEKAIADATSQLEKISDARAMINGNAESQALGIPKVLTALVSGAGSGVRITQPELNAIGTARGIKGDVEGFVNSISGKGKLTDTQKQQLTGILNDVEARVRQKQAIANDALDKINGAGSREEIIQHDKNARKALSDLEAGHAADPAVKAYADKFFGGDLKKAQAAIDSQKKK